MNEAAKSTEGPAGTPAARPAARKFFSWLPVFVLIGVFLAGFVPKWLESTRLHKELVSAQREARLEQIQITFANAALDARRGDYEAARQGMTGFFSLVTAEMDRGFGSALPAGTLEGLRRMLAERDELITLLARGDPASAERLGNLYADFRKTVGR